MCWILDFGGYSLKNAPPLKVSIHCNHVLQNHFPERLGLAICYHAPTLFSLTWKVRVVTGLGRCGRGHFRRDGRMRESMINHSCNTHNLELKLSLSPWGL